MATSAVVCNDLLCFLLNKYGKVNNKVLKDILVESFEVTVIHEAKIRLLEDISALGSCDEILPYISEDKQVNEQPTDDIDDMYALLILATDHKLIEKIPRYVTDKPDLLPGAHLTDGDMRIFVGWLKKMDDRLCSVESTLAAMTANIDQLSETLAKVQTTMGIQGPPPVELPNAEWPALPARPVINTTDTATGFSSVLSTSVSTLASVSNSSQSAQLPRQTASHLQMQTLRSTADWSTAMSTPQTLAVARSSEGYGLDTNAAEEFKTVRPRRRRRVHSSAEVAEEASDENTTHTRRLGQGGRAPTAPLVYGKAKLGERNARIITAPKSFVRKSVFCVDNIDASFTADDVRNFVSKMSVRVVSCFEAKPRRRRSDELLASATSDRKAFRLCINSDDCEMLLNDDKWPAHVTVSKWFFKQTSSTTNQPEQRITSLDPNTAVAESACSQPPQKLARPDLSNNAVSDDETDMDDTISVQQPPSTDVLAPAATQD